MTKEKSDDGKEVVVAEFNVFMHCDACEKTVAKTISKIKGVETFTTDMNRHKVVVTGDIDPKKVLKKLKKKTGKKIEMMMVDDKNKEKKATESEGDGAAKEFPNAQVEMLMLHGCWKENDAFWIFSDENPNACSIM